MIKALQIQHNSTIEKILRLAKEAGFEQVSIGFGSSDLFHNEGWETEVEKIKGTLDKLGLKCALTHLPYHNLTVNSDVPNERMDEAIRRCIIATAMLGADRTAMHTRTYYLGDGLADAEKSKSDNLALIKRFIPTAREAKVIIGIENLPKFKKYPLYPHTTEDLLDLFEELDDPAFGICWDFGHALMTGLDQEKALRKIGKNLKLTHIHDNFVNDDQHLIPGFGVTNWKKLMPILSEIGYDGPLMLEIVYEDTPSLGTYFKLAYERLCELCDMMN